MHRRPIPKLLDFEMSNGFVSMFVAFLVVLRKLREYNLKTVATTAGIGDYL